MEKLLLFFFLLPLFVKAQSGTIQLNFTYKNGSVVGRAIVMDMPTSLFNYWVPQGQLLIFYPPAYYAGKKCGLIVWNNGDGENTSLDVSETYRQSLPRMINAGLTPYSILPNKDTLFWVVAMEHNNAGSAYRSQQQQIIPWILNKSGIKYDSSHVWVSGLSGGGSGTWASVMNQVPTNGASWWRIITGIIPMANGGYDNNLDSLKSILTLDALNGMWFFPYIGTQDPGYNPSGFFRYDSLLKKYAEPGHYIPRIIQGGTHSANVWDVPWNSRGLWDSLGAIGWTAPVTVNPVHAKVIIDSLVIHYPNTSFVLADSSIGSSWSSWGVFMYPTGFPGRWSSYQTQKGMLLSNLVGGDYGLQFVAGDNNGNTDTIRAVLRVYGPPACPACPVCPAPRKVVNIIPTMIGNTWQLKFVYDDGTTQ